MVRLVIAAWLLLAVFLLVTMTSCSSEQAATSRPMAVSNSLTQVGTAIQNGHDTVQVNPPGLPGGEGGQPTTSGTSTAPPSIDRQIIYRATINLQVKSFAECDREIGARVKAAGGYIAQFQEDRSYGNQRGGRWTVRLPAAGFTDFLEAVSKLGIAERRDVQSQDVTEEYVDLEARLKNKQALEARLLDLVAKRGDGIKDVIALENEMNRVTEEIERLQGKLRYLSNRIALTTVEISAYEKLDYQPAEATFVTRVGNTFWVSLDNLRQLGEGLLLTAVALGPWLVVGAVLYLPMALIMRRVRGKQRMATASV